MQVINKKIKRN